MYEGHFWGMHMIWWIVWVFLLIWIFALPFQIPGQRDSEKNAIAILKQRFAKGEVSKEEYQERLQVLKDNN